MPDFKTYLKQKAALVNNNLAGYIAALDDTPEILKSAMLYSVQAGGKRLRPVLLMASAEAFGAKAKTMLPAACALEMIHTYSLIHDDLPAMDNDDLRRGKPTSHKVFGEDTAILAGDALLTYAFEVFCQNAKTAGFAATLNALSCLADAAGACGMVGGQVSDIYAEGLPAGKSKRAGALAARRTVAGNISKSGFLLPKSNLAATPERVLDYIHCHKTAALIKTSVETGAILAGAKEPDLKNMREYGLSIGMAFQITDDILDVTADKKKLGKKGSDAKNNKLTYATLYGLDTARVKARSWADNAKKALDRIRRPKAKLAPLYSLAAFMTERTY